jgi:hypothetical protein
MPGKSFFSRLSPQIIANMQLEEGLPTRLIDENTDSTDHKFLNSCRLRIFENLSELRVIFVLFSMTVITHVLCAAVLSINIKNGKLNLENSILAESIKSEDDMRVAYMCFATALPLLIDVTMEIAAGVRKWRTSKEISLTNFRDIIVQLLIIFALSSPGVVGALAQSISSSTDCFLRIFITYTEPHCILVGSLIAITRPNHEIWNATSAFIIAALYGIGQIIQCSACVDKSFSVSPAAVIIQNISSWIAAVSFGALIVIFYKDIFYKSVWSPEEYACFLYTASLLLSFATVSFFFYELNGLTEFTPRFLIATGIITFFITTVMVVLPNRISKQKAVIAATNETLAVHEAVVLRSRTDELRKEKILTDALIHQMLPSSVASCLRAGKYVEPELFGDATVFFSDVVGFTAISATISPLAIVTLLNRLYVVMDHCASKFPIWKVETIGNTIFHSH